MDSRISMPLSQAGHPAFFNGKMLAEALPNGTYRFTRQVSDDFFVVIMSNPSIGRARVEFAGKDGKLYRSGANGAHGPVGILPGIYSEGKDLLDENGYAIEKNRGISHKLSSLQERLEKEAGVDPDSFHDGDCVMAPLTGNMDGSTGFVAFKANTPPASTKQERFDCDSPMVCKQYSADHLVLDAGGNEYKTSWWKTSGKYLPISNPEFEWLQEAMDYTAGEAGFAEGLRLFGEAAGKFQEYGVKAAVKAWKGEERIITRMPQGRTTLGGVAV